VQPVVGLHLVANHVDVDADGQVDTAEKPYNQADVICVVF